MFVEQLQAVIDLLEAAKADAAKVDTNRAGTPGTRLRQKSTAACKLLASLKKNVLDIRTNSKGEKA